LRENLDDEPEILDLFQSLGPDLNVFCYAINFKVDGRLNTRLDLMNEFNNALFHRMSHEVPDTRGEVPRERSLRDELELFDRAPSARTFMRAFARRAGVRYGAGGRSGISSRPCRTRS
jgi:hypothetical protein